jgi:hypothetical protein
MRSLSVIREGGMISGENPRVVKCLCLVYVVLMGDFEAVAVEL